MSKNLLYYGDNLEILRRYIEDESVDLVYLDPPFNSNQDYNVLFAERSGTKSAAQIKAFEDTWRWDLGAEEAFREVVETGGPVSEAMQAFRTFLGESDMMAYLAMVAPRLVELRRVLKGTGSIYLHCDPTASHYLKMLLDAVFGPGCFRNEIVWKRTNARSTRGKWPRVHDVILYYGASKRAMFDPVSVPGDPAKLPHTLVTGPDGRKYQSYELTAAGTRNGPSGEEWRGFDPGSKGRHWSNVPETLEEWDAKGLIHWPRSGGFPRRRAEKPFVASSRTVFVGDVWTDIDRINQSAKERLGYPTQKPEELLERILQASSKEGHVVLDPFCGCGTTIAAAQNLERNWIGIDITHLAVALIKHRLQSTFGSEAQFEVVGEPVSLPDAKELAAEDPFQFQWWALGLVGARPVEQKKGADKGIDGRLYFHEKPTGGDTKQIVLSVKAGKLQAQHVRDLRGVIEREKAAIGVLISMAKPTKAMRAEAASAGFYESEFAKGKYPRMQLLTVEELLGGKRIECPPHHTNVSLKSAPKARKKSRPHPKLFDHE